MESSWIRCKVLPGMFSSERLVVIEEPGQGELLSIFVDGSLVEVDSELRSDEPVWGRLRVDFSRVAERLNVFLPVTSPEHGRVVSLAAELLVV